MFFRYLFMIQKLSGPKDSIGKIAFLKPKKWKILNNVRANYAVCGILPILYWQYILTAARAIARFDNAPLGARSA